MNMMQARRSIAVGLAGVLILALSACTATSGGDGAAADSAATEIDPAAQADLDRLRALPFDESSVGVLTDVLEGAGVHVVPDVAADTDDAAPVVVTEWQVANMAAEVANGGGLTGAELAELAPVPEGAPPFGYLVVAWASVYDSDGARFTRAVLGDADLRRADLALFPRAVLTLFLSDATTATEDGSPQAGHEGGSPRAGREGGSPGEIALAGMTQYARGGGPCTAATDFVHNAIGAVADALKVKESGGFFGFLGRIWNKAVDLAAGLITGLIEAVTRPVVTLLVDVFGVVAVIQQVSTFLSVWRADITPDPRETRFGVGSEVVTGSATLTIRDNRVKLPALLVDCAAAVGVDLERVGSAAGSAITWDAANDPRPDLTGERSSDDELDEDQSATYEFTTGQEPASLAKDGEEQGGMLHLRANVHRNDLEQVRLLFTRLLLDQVPAGIRPLVDRVAAPVLGEATRHLASLGDVRASTYVWVTFHLPREKAKPSSKPSAPGGSVSPQEPSACGVNGVAPGHYALAYESASSLEYSSSRWDITVDESGAISGSASRVKGGTDFEGDYEWHLELRYAGTVEEPTVTVVAADGAFLAAEEAWGGGVGTTSTVLSYTGDCGSLSLTDELDLQTGAPRRLPRV